ncbi:hypothetical protein IIA28_08720 [candidate division KSB1 bacterium]|nr:hypothetical protein [candidate division KSB1 bacterium]MCH8873448.1 hypothetical protein [candidate division KSB1 bacterium]MCH8955379.1 hypothetical protein [candidate division KSB1 bacterium]
MKILKLILGLLVGLALVFFAVGSFAPRLLMKTKSKSTLRWKRPGQFSPMNAEWGIG